jgi:hypothetical protein
MRILKADSFAALRNDNQKTGNDKNKRASNDKNKRASNDKNKRASNDKNKGRSTHEQRASTGDDWVSNGKVTKHRQRRWVTVAVDGLAGLGG